MALLLSSLPLATFSLTMSQKPLSPSTQRRSPYRLSQECHIHRIPAETLAEIFLLIREGPAISSVSTERDHDQIHVANFALLSITAVCLRWRLVAADFGALWTNIAFSTLKASSIQCAELFLQRTKSCALRVYVSAPALQGTPAISAMMHKLFAKISSETHRIRAFNFLATSWTSVLYTYWTDPTINPRQIQGIRDTEPPLSCRPFPRVESMSLFSPTWYPSFAPSLKNLELWNTRHIVSLHTLLHALGGCPGLESLKLQGYRRFVDENTSDALATTTLPNLHRLRLSSCNSTPILASLHLPSLTDPLVIFDSHPCEDILHHLRRQQGASYLKGISKLQVVLNMGDSEYSVAAYREDGHTNLYLGVSAVSHLFRWRWIRESMETVTSFRPFSKVTILSITADILFVSWSPLLSKMHHLSRLELCCPDKAGYLASLSSLVDGSLLCPSLNTLALRGSQQSSRLDY